MMLTMEVVSGRRELKNLENLQNFFGNPANKQKVKEAIRTRGKYFCRKGKGEIYHLPLGTSNGKKMTIEILYEYGKFKVLSAFVENVQHVG